MVTIQVPVDEWLEVAQTLRDDSRFAFSQLTDLCGVDYLGFGQVEWETTDATHEGFSRGVEGMGARVVSNGKTGPNPPMSNNVSVWLYTCFQPVTTCACG